MFLYEGLSCPSCGVPFSDGDDVVSCPACGAPHHRDCWNKLGHCHYEALHGTEEGWKRPERRTRPDNGNMEYVCDRCGAANEAGAEHCAFCGGDSLRSAPRQPHVPMGETSVPLTPGYGGLADPMGGVQPDERFGEVSAGDVAQFVGQNTAYYMRRFGQMEKQKTWGGFNFAALFFSGVWMIYRKMYKLGALITGAMALLHVATLYIQATYVVPLLNGIYERAGISLTEPPDSGAIMRLYSEGSKLSQQENLLLLVPAALFLLAVGIGIVCACVSNKLYYNHCVGKVRDITRTAESPADIPLLLKKQGGVNFAVVLSIALCYFLISNVIAPYLLPVLFV